MKFTPNLQLYLIILIVVGLLLLLLWFRLRNPWKEYATRLTQSLIDSNPELKKITWSESSPNPNGGWTSSGEYELSGDVGKIRITASEVNNEVLKDFINEAKFYFEPIFEKIPSAPMSQSGEVSDDDNELDPEEQKNELLVELDLQTNTKSDSNGIGNQIQAIAFIVDPRLAQGKSQTYSARATAAYAAVSVSEGSVNATLKPGVRRSDRANIGTGGSASLYSETYPRNRSFKSKVKGTSGSNYFRLSGTWNAG